MLTGVVSVGNYRSQLLQRGIGWLKFKSIQSVAQPLATLLLPKLEFVAPITQLQSDGVLVPIPLHPRRQKERGFNQALEIAQALSQYTGIRVIEALARNRATWVQSHLPTELRAQNVENVFTQTQDISDYSKIIIIDDVATSGATLNAAAHALALPSSAQIWACTIARG